VNEKKPAFGAFVAAACCAAILGVLVVSCRPGFQRAPGVVDAMLYETPPLVRVALVVRGAGGAAAVASGGPYLLADCATGKVLASGSRLPLSSISAGGSGLRIGGREFASSSLRLRPRGSKPLALNGSSYAGDLLFFRDAAGVTVVNELDVERYVDGLLAAEMPLYFDDDALKAQAVAARTYVLYEAKTSTSPYYDVVSTQQSQVYKGLSAATRKARRLVSKTRGIILTVKGKTFPTYFHSTCGGHTNDVSDVWPSVSIGPLRGVPCGYDQHSRVYRWQVTVPAAELARALEERQLFSGPVEDVTVTRRADSAYATRVQVRGPRGKRELNAYDFRMALASKGLKSACFWVSRSASGFVFQGRGWGHGVGLCQYGADGMGRQGYNYRQILAHYYPGAQFVRIYP